MGLASLATAALIGWEWLQRETDIFATFDVAHYRPKERPTAVRVVHVKTGEENWIPLFDDQRRAALSRTDGRARRDQARAHRRADAAPRLGRARAWPTWPTPEEIDLTHMSRKTKEIIRAAGLRDELTFTSFRHGGFTEAADADLSDAQMRAQGRHKSAKVLPTYAKRTMRQVAEGARKRRATQEGGTQ